MSKLDIKKIKQIRQETSAGVMEVKKALSEANGDIEQAKKILQKQGLVKAKKRGKRSTGSGLIESYIHSGGKVGILLEVNCETDFVARTDVFKQLAHDLAMQIAAMNPESVKILLEQDFIKDSSKKVDNLIKSVIASTGENVVVRRFIRYALNDLN